MTVPSFRATKDVSIPEDLVEEVGRIHGYGNVPPQPPLVAMRPQPRNELRLFERRLKTHLTSGLGFDEVVLYAFQSRRGIELFDLPTEPMLTLAKPLSEDFAHLKRCLIPDLLLLLEKNAPLERFRLFEYGRTYMRRDDAPSDLPREERRLVGLVYDRAWDESPAAFAQAKGAVQGLRARLKLPPADYRPEPTEAPWSHPSRRARIVWGERVAGEIAEVHPAVLKELGVPGRAAYFDLDVETMLAVGVETTVFEELPRYPSVTLDLSIAAPEKTLSIDLIGLARVHGRRAAPFGLGRGRLSRKGAGARHQERDPASRLSQPRPHPHRSRDPTGTRPSHREPPRPRASRFVESGA